MVIALEHRLLPELRGLNAVIPRVNQAADPIGTRHVIAEAQRMGPQYSPPVTVKVLQIHIPSGDKDGRTIRSLVIVPSTEADETRAVIWFTEGAGIFGAPEASLPLLCKIAEILKITCIAPAYALAPELPWPAAYNDALAVWEYVTSTTGAETLQMSPKAALVIGGTSFGGLLAARLAQHLATSLRQPAAVILDSAALAQPTAESPVQLSPLEKYHIVTHRNTHECQEVVRLPQEAWPSSASDAVLARLPPHFIGCAELDVLQPPVLLYAHRLLTQGVPVGLRLERGTFHCWTSFTPDLPVTEELHSAYIAFIESITCSS